MGVKTFVVLCVELLVSCMMNVKVGLNERTSR